MNIKTTPYNDLFNNTAKKLAERTGISNFGPDSKAFSLISAFINEDKFLISQTEQVFSSLRLQDSVRKDLDIIGESFGLKRELATKAFTLSTEKNQEFYVQSGTFGDINDGSSIVVPANTSIFLSEKDSLTGNRIEYRTTSSTTLVAANSSTFFSIEAFNFGTQGNVGSKSLINHDFTNYAGAASQSLKTRNNYAIVNGRNTFSDEQYRFLISKIWTTLANCNDTALRMTALGVPGVKDIKVIKYYNGIGTTGLIIDTFEGIISNNLLTSVKNRVTPVLSEGELVYTYGPKYVALEFEIIIKTKNLLSSIDKIAFTKQVLSFTRNFINNFSLGQAFNGSTYLENLILLNNNFIKIGRKPNKNSFEFLNAYYLDSIGQYSKKQMIVDTISLAEDQKIILLDTTDNPITVRFEKV